MSIMTRGFSRSECCHVAQENEEKTPPLGHNGADTVEKEHENWGTNPSSASNRLSWASHSTCLGSVCLPVKWDHTLRNAEVLPNLKGMAWKALMFS